MVLSVIGTKEPSLRDAWKRQSRPALAVDPRGDGPLAKTLLESAGLVTEWNFNRKYHRLPRSQGKRRETQQTFYSAQIFVLRACVRSGVSAVRVARGVVCECWPGRLSV